MESEALEVADDDGIDLRKLVATLWQGKWPILGITVLFAVAAVAIALLAKPIYRAEALVQIRREVGGDRFGALAAQLGGLADFGAISGGSGDERALALATLKSRTVIQAFIQDRGLLPQLFPQLWDTENKRWDVKDPKDQPTLWLGYRVFTETILKIAEDKKTGLVTVAVEWSDPQATADWVTDLIARTNAQLREKTVRESERNLEYLQQQLKQTGQVELQQSAYALVEAELKKLMLAKSEGEYALKTIDPAQVPQERIRPKRRQIAVLGLVMGSLFGIAFVLTRKALLTQKN